MPASVLAMTLPRHGTRWLISAIVTIGWSIRVLPLALHGLVGYPIDYDQGSTSQPLRSSSVDRRCTRTWCMSIPRGFRTRWRW